MSAVSRILVLTGSMRSGTSLLGHIMQKKSDGMRAYEDLAFDNDESKRLGSVFSKLRAYTPTEASASSGLLNHDVLDAIDIPAGSLEHRIAALREVFLSEIEQLAPKGPIPKLYGFKRTSINHALDLITALFDDVRVVFTVRDPRDILLSHRKRVNADMRDGNALLILAYALSNHEMILRRQKQGKDTLVIPYERAVRYPVDVTKDILDYCSLAPEKYDFDSLLTSDVPNNSSFGAGGGLEFVKGKGITTTSIGRHKTELDADMSSFVNYLCGHILTSNGYETTLENVDWDPDFEPLLTAMAKRCKQLHISLHAVEARLKELNAPLTDLS
ncbi:MAG: sulfotransferase [Pseudomonadota bacterium]